MKQKDKYYLTLAGQEVEVPGWATYLAQDEDGEWNFFSSKPKFCTNHVVGVDFWWAETPFGTETHAAEGKEPADAGKEVYRIMREGAG